MPKKEVSVFSLSLLDLLFCAFGGVIVLTVVFSAIIKYEQAQSEKSRKIALHVDIEYTNPIGFPEWEVNLRKSPAGSGKMIPVNGIKIFEDTDLTIFDSIILGEKGKFQFALEGKLNTIPKNDAIADTIHVQLDPKHSSGSYEWKKKSGDIILSALIYRHGKLPQKIELQTISSENLYNHDQSLPIIFILANDIVTIQTY